MRPVGWTLAISLLVAGLAGCQLIDVLRPTGLGPMPSEGTCATYQVVATDAQPVTADTLEQSRSIIENRVNATGVAEPVVSVDDDGLLHVGIPLFAPDDEVAHQIRALITAPGVLEFVPVPAAYFGQVYQGAPLPEGMADTPPLFTGVEIDQAALREDEMTGEIILDLELKPTGAQLFDEYAAEHYGDQFAIVLDGIVQSAPTINATRFGGRAQISGDFTAAEAANLVTVLKFGALPLEIREVGVGACEGSSSS